MKKELLEEIRRELEELKKRKEFDQEHISLLINKYIKEISEKDSYNIYMYMGSFRVGTNGKLFFEAFTLILINRIILIFLHFRKF